MLEIVFAILGLSILTTGVFPPRLFLFVFGKRDYTFPVAGARRFGWVLLSPVPLSLITTLLVMLFLGQDDFKGIFIMAEIFFDVVTVIFAIRVTNTWAAIAAASEQQPTVKYEQLARQVLKQDVEEEPEDPIEETRSRARIGLIIASALTPTVGIPLMLFGYDNPSWHPGRTLSFWDKFSLPIVGLTIIVIGIFVIIKCARDLNRNR
jgi:hypothetical protein